MAGMHSNCVDPLTLRLYLMNDELDQCQYTCMNLLKTDADNEEATVMMADLAFRYYQYFTIINETRKCA